MQRKWILATLLFAISVSAAAHHAWLAPAPAGDYRILLGHPGNTSAYDPDHVVGVTLLGRHGQVLAVARSANAGTVHVQPKDASITVGLAAFTFETGNTIKTAAGDYVHGSKQDYGDYARAFYSVSTGKSLFAWNHKFTEPVGLELEIVPLANPYSLENSQQLPVRVLYKGEPLAEVKVHYVTSTGAPGTATTHADGRTSVAIDVDQRRIITVTHHAALPKNKDVDERSIRAFLYIYPRVQS